MNNHPGLKVPLIISNPKFESKNTCRSVNQTCDERTGQKIIEKI